VNSTEVEELGPTGNPEYGGFIETMSLICALIMNVMCILGVVANSLSLFIYTRPTFNKRSINVFLAALSASDLVVSLLAVPVFSISQLQSLMPGTPMITATVMLYFYPVTLMAQTMSVWLLVAITLDRYMAVCHPFVVASYCTKKRAVLTVFLILAFAIAYNFVRFWEFTLKETNSTGIVEDLLDPLLRRDPMFMLLYQNILTVITQFLLPLVVLCVFNFEVILAIRKATEQRRDLVSSVKREHSTAKMMIYVVIVFIFCYTFSFMLNVAEMIDEDLFRSAIGYLLNDVNNILIVLNSSSSIIFYCKYSTRYRAQLMRTCSLGFILKRVFVAPGRGDKGTVILSECSALMNTAVPSPSRNRTGSKDHSPRSSCQGSSARCSTELTLPISTLLLKEPEHL
ncbi:hypothetical protein PFISCL1PPCAC_8302, partial [Pristionchus fissidentatus]